MAKKERQPWLEARNGVYYVHWYDKSAGRIKRLSTGERDAGKARVAFSTFLAGGLCADTTDAQAEITCGMVLDDYLREHVRKKAADPARIERCVEYLSAHFGPVPVSQANDPVAGYGGRMLSRAEHYCERRAANEIGGALHPRASSGATHRLELSVLITAINRAVRTRRLPPDQVPYIPLPDASPPRDRWLSEEELACLMRAARAQDEYQVRLSRAYRFIVLAYYTASRRAALESLTWFQVDTKDWTKIALGKPGARQTKKRRPIIPISPGLLPALKLMYEERVNEYVLDSPRSIYDEFKSAAKRAGLHDISPHTLRHTRATHLLQQGVSMWQVAGLLGDTLATVGRVYGHHCPDHLGEVLEADRKGMGL
jgi:integrase